MGKEYKPYFCVPFLKYYGRFETYFRSYLNQRLELTKITDKGASLEKNAIPKKEFDELVAERRNNQTIFKCDSLLKQKLLSLIYANRNRIFIFVISPYHSSYFSKYVNINDAHSFLNLLRSCSNVRVFDFSKIPLSDDMFLNTSHVNFKGAIIFNRYLKDSLSTTATLIALSSLKVVD